MTAASSPATSTPGDINVRVVWFAQPDQLRGDAAAQWSILARSRIDQTAWTGHDEAGVDPLNALFTDVDWVVDALLGTGLTRPVER